MRKALDSQLKENLAKNVRERSRDIAIGQEICRLDMQSVNNERAMRDFKRERFSKAMRDAWQEQTEYKKFMKKIQQLF